MAEKLEDAERKKFTREILSGECEFRSLERKYFTSQLATLAHDCGRLCTDIQRLEVICKTAGEGVSADRGAKSLFANQMVWGFVKAGMVQSMEVALRCARLIRRDGGAWSLGAESELVPETLKVCAEEKESRVAEFMFLLKNERSLDVFKSCLVVKALLNKDYMCQFWSK
jgi:hypothetical protein